MKGIRVCPGRVVMEVGILTPGLVLDTARRAISGIFGEFIRISHSSQAPACSDGSTQVRAVGRIPVMGTDVVRSEPCTDALIRDCSSTSDASTTTAKLADWRPAGI